MSKQIPERIDKQTAAERASGFESLRSSTENCGPVEQSDDPDRVDHYAIVYEDRAEQFATVVPFVREGLERDERCMYVLDDTSRDEVIGMLRDAGIDVDSALDSGQLSLHTAAETYLHDGEFDVDDACDLLEEAMEEALEEYEGFRVTAEETWLVDDGTAQEAFTNCEAHMNDLLEGERGKALCQYDRTQLPPSVIEDVIETHPYLVYDDTICQNVYYTPPEEYFGHDRPDRDNERKLETLVDRTTARATLETREEYKRKLNEVISCSDCSFEKKLDALFELGRERFGLEVGGLAKVDPESDLFEIEAVSGEHDQLVPGTRVALSETYCRVVTNEASGDAVAEPVEITDPGDSGFENAVCAAEFDLHSYLGTLVPVDDDLDRTLFFVSEEPRDRTFTDAERTFHRLMAEWVQYELERRRREREFRERTEHLDALIETTPECIKTVDADGILRQMNSAGLDMVEVDEASAVVGECIYEVIAPEDRDRFREFNERICGDERGTLEFDIVGLEGTRRHMKSHAAPLVRPDGTTVQVAITHDVTEQKEREAELRQTKNRFETVFEQSDDAILLLDPQADEFVDVNPTTSRRLGYSREELLSMGPSELYPGELGRFSAFIDEVRETGSAWSDDLHCRHQDGRDIPTEVTASTITLDGRDLVLANVRHIEERKEHERYQRELYEITAAADLEFEEKIEQLLELGRDRFDLEMAALSHLSSWDGEFRLETGIELGVDADEELRSDPGNDCYCRRTLADENPVGMADVRETEWTEDEIYREFGLTSYLGTNVSSDSTTYGTLWFGSTEPRDEPFSAAERSFIELMGQSVGYEIERREHNESQRKLYEITADPELGTDEKIDRLLGMGCDRLDLSLGMLARERERTFEIEHLHGTHHDLAEGELAPTPTDDYCRRVVDTDTAVSVADAGTAGRDEDGLTHEVDLRCYAGTRVAVGGEPVGTICFADTSPREEFTDTERAFLDLVGQCVSYELERQEYERELEVTVDQLQQSNEQLEQFAYAASHDLQEPLRMVTSYLQLLETRYSDTFDEDGEEFLEFAVDGAERMRKMIDGLLEYSRVETRGDPFEPVELHEVLDDVLEDLQLQIDESDAEITSDELPRVEGDASQLRQVLQNLLDNAITYSGDGPPRIHVGTERRSDEWVISVRDDGIGVDPSDRDRIFAVFDRLHSRDEYEGTGLGLSLCQRIVERHEGEIWVESEPGDGSTFSFTIPAATDH